MPINLHPIPQRHPQIRLLLRRHSLPPLLYTGQRRVRDRMSASRTRLLSLFPLQTHHWRRLRGTKEGRGQEGGAAGRSSRKGA